MTRTIVFLEPDLQALRSHLLQNVGGSGDEEAAVIMAGVSRLDDEVRLLVREVVPVPRSALLEQGPGGVHVDPAFLARYLKLCRAGSLSFVLAHSHPFSTKHVAFSGIDDRGERELMPKLFARAPGGPHGAIVIAQEAIAVRVWESADGGTLYIDRVRVVGGGLFDMDFGTSTHFTGTDFDRKVFDRQIRAVGEEGMHALRRLTVGVVGLGGTGSHIFQQLVRLGISRFILVDPDRVGAESLPRVIGASPDDAKKTELKVVVMARLAKEFDDRIHIVELPGSVYDHDVAMELRQADIIVTATDTMVSRLVLTRLAVQYLIPVIDTGIDIQLDQHGAMRRIGGRITILYPDGPCLECLGVLDHEQLHAEVHYNGAPRGYAGAAPVPAAAVIAHNALVASAAVARVLQLATPKGSSNDARVFWMYDGIRGTIRQIALRAARECSACADARARGDSIDLPCIRVGAGQGRLGTRS